MKFFKSAAALILLVVTLALPFPQLDTVLQALGFPATVSTDDPFVNE